jgi:hypothetical protein
MPFSESLRYQYVRGRRESGRQIFSKLFPSISLAGIRDTKGLRPKKFGIAIPDIRSTAVNCPSPSSRRAVLKGCDGKAG